MNKIEERHQVFHSFCTYPRIRFDGQHDREQVILILRAHPITQIFWLINSFFFLILVIGLISFVNRLLSPGQIFFIMMFSFSLIFSYLWFNFLGWYFNVGLITNERAVDIDFHSVIYKEVTMAMASKIEDVTSKSGGFFCSFFDYGNVFIQTAGTEANIEFINIPKPSEVVRNINQMIGNQ